MIAVTERAKKELKTRLVASGADPDEGLRLLPRPKEPFVLVIDNQLPADQVVGYEGYKVLLLGIEYFNILDGTVLDCHDTKDGPVLFLKKYGGT